MIMDPRNVSNENMMPVDHLEKRPKLRRIKKKAKFDLNASNNNSRILQPSSRLNISLSAANTSVVKASLRANNKALAQTLEKVRLDLRMSYEVNNDMKRHNQELQLRLNSLERVVGLKDESLEREVQLRMENKMQQLKHILSSVSVHLLDAGSYVQDALDKCLDPSRLSINSSGARNSSLGPLDDAHSPPAAASSIYYKPKSVFCVSSVDGQGSLPDNSMVTSGEQDDVTVPQQEMSLILEQSLLLDTADVPQVLALNLPAVLESETQSDVSVSSVSPRNTARRVAQRVECYNGRRKTMESRDVQSTNTIEEFSIADAVDQRSRRETSMIPTAASTEVENVSLDRRGTFVIGGPSGGEKPNNNPIRSALSKSARRNTFLFKAAPPMEDEPVKDVEDDVTLYPDTDMEMTEIIHAAWEEGAVEVERSKKDNSVTFHSSCKRSPESRMDKDDEKRKKAKSKIAKSVSLLPRKEKDSKTWKSDGVKESDDTCKSAVVLQLRKPGSIVFTASRRELDGSRKAVTSSKARSKSKKEIRELKESIAADTSVPKTIFDFHDKTPVHLTEKSRIEPSVYDISMDDQSRCDPPNLGRSECCKKADSKKWEADAVVYNLPLKCSPDGEVARMRTRSKSRSRRPAVEGDTDDVEVERRCRSKSRRQSKKREATESPNSRNDGERSRSRNPRSRSSKQDGENTDAGSKDDVDVKPTIRSEDGTIAHASKDVAVTGGSGSLDSSDRKRRKLVCTNDSDEDFKVAKSRTMPIGFKTSKHSGEPSEETKPAPQSDDVGFSSVHTEKKAIRACKTLDRLNNLCDGDNEVARNEDAKISDNTDSSHSASAGKRVDRAAKAKALGKNMCETGEEDDCVAAAHEDAARADTDELDPDVQKDVVLIDDAIHVAGDFLSPKDFVSSLNCIRPKRGVVDSTGDSGAVDGSLCKAGTGSGVPIAESCEQTMADDKHSDKRTVADDKHSDKRTIIDGNRISSSKASTNMTEVSIIEKDLQYWSTGKGAASPVALGTKALNKIERGRSPRIKQLQNNDLANVRSKRRENVQDILANVRSKRRENVQDILQAFTDFDDPDHSLHLNAVLRNDSIVIAEAIRNTSHADINARTCQSLAALEEAGKEMMYTLPLKDSPVVQRTTKVRSRSRSCKARSKKRSPIEESDEDDNDVVKSKADSDPEYCLPLKGSPTEEDGKKTKSRSKSRARSRSRGRRIVYVPDPESDEDDNDVVKSKADTDPVYSLPLKGSPTEEDGKKTKSRSKSRARSQSRGRRIVDVPDTDPVYSLPLKGSPTEEDGKKTKSRSKSRARSRSRGRRIVDNPDSDPDFQVDKPKTAAKKSSKENVGTGDTQPVTSDDGRVQSKDDKGEVYSLPLKEAPANSKTVTSRSRSKSRSRVGEQGRSRSQRRVAEESPKGSNRSEALEITVQKNSPDVRSVKKVHMIPDAAEVVVQDEVNADGSGRRSATSSVKKLTKKKEADSVTSTELESKETQQDELMLLKARLSELKPLFLGPVAAGLEKHRESSFSLLKQKLDATEFNNRYSDIAGEKRSRRAASSVSYKEPAMNSKLRRGDPGTSHFCASEPLKIFKSPPKFRKDISTIVTMITQHTDVGQ